MTVDPVLGVLAIPLLASAILALLPGYRVSAWLNAGASLLSLLCALLQHGLFNRVVAGRWLL